MRPRTRPSYQVVTRRCVTAIVIGTLLGAAVAGEIDGTIVVKHRLTPRKVTAPASAYQRGIAVDLGGEPFRNAPGSHSPGHASPANDALAYERAHVAVYLEGPLPAQPAAAAIAQENRIFVPDLLVIPVGSTVSFPNQDPIFHNVFSLSKAKLFDLGNYPKGQTRTVTFSKTGVVLVNCYLHPNMAAAIVVAPNAWCTKADKDGRFTLPNVPPGEYTAVAWHKSSGFFRQPVQVAAQGRAAIEFLIPVDEDGLAKVTARR